MRLIAGMAKREGGATAFSAGIEITLNPGWKTYWRYPGDSGVPPRMDFAKSDNVKEVSVGWPAPLRFKDGDDTSIGYKREVIFPLRVTPIDAAKPVRLRLALDYAVCEKLCIPVMGSAELLLTGSVTAQDGRLAAAQARVPSPAEVGKGSGLAIRAVKREPGNPGRVVVDVAAPDGMAVDLFAEGPTAEWALPLPEPVPGAPAGVKRFSFALDGLPPGARADGATLTLTAVMGESGIEATYRLDSQ